MMGWGNDEMVVRENTGMDVPVIKMNNWERAVYAFPIVHNLLLILNQPGSFPAV